MDSDAHDAKVKGLRIDFNVACNAHLEAQQVISDAERVLVETRLAMRKMRNAYCEASTARDDFLKDNVNG